MSGVAWPISASDGDRSRNQCGNPDQTPGLFWETGGPFIKESPFFRLGSLN